MSRRHIKAQYNQVVCKRQRQPAHRLTEAEVRNARLIVGAVVLGSLLTVIVFNHFLN